MLMGKSIGELKPKQIKLKKKQTPKRTKERKERRCLTRLLWSMLRHICLVVWPLTSPRSSWAVRRLLLSELKASTFLDLSSETELSSKNSSTRKWVTIQEEVCSISELPQECSGKPSEEWFHIWLPREMQL